MLIIGAYPKSFESSTNGEFLDDLESFINSCFSTKIGLHILPFYPNSGDDGFAVDNWFCVDEKNGNWCNLINLARKRNIYIDVIYNHVGKNHHLAKSLLSSPSKYKDFFYTFKNYEMEDSTVSPRGRNMLETYNISGEKWYIWQTYSKLAFDINLDNIAIRSIISQHLEFLKNIGITGVRMDAPAFFGKKLCTNPLHSKDSYRLTREITALIKSYNLDLIAQLDCDNQGLKYYSNYMDWNVILIDFSYSAKLLFSFLTGNVKYISLHINETRSVKHRILRAPRTHDGFLMRSGNFENNFINTLSVILRSVSGNVREIDGKPYEVNSSLPYLLSVTGSVNQMWDKIRICIILTSLISDISYLYLPFITGFIPEKKYKPTKDPRQLNRQPISIQYYNDLKENKNYKETCKLINELCLICRVTPSDRISMNSYSEHYGESILIIYNTLLNLKLVANFSSKKKFLPNLESSTESLLSQNKNQGSLDGYGFALYNIH